MLKSPSYCNQLYLLCFYIFDFSSPDPWLTYVYRSNYVGLRRILSHSYTEIGHLAFAMRLIEHSEYHELSLISNPVERSERLLSLLERGGKLSFPILLEMLVHLGEHDMHDRLRLAIVSPGNGKCCVALNISIHIHTSPVSISSIVYMIAV